MQTQINKIKAALMLSVLAAPRNTLYDVDVNTPLSVGVYAAESDNLVFDVSVPSAAEAAAATLGTREIWIAPVGASGVAAAGDFILLSKLRAGDTGPTPEAVTEDTTFDNGAVVSNQTGVNNGSKTWDIEGSADEPAISMLIDHCRIDGYGTAAKRGKPFAYIAFNEDRSSFSGGAKVNTASASREGGHRWSFNVPFETVNLRRPAQNPVSSAGSAPSASDITPDSGAVGSTVAIIGANLNVITALDFGADSIAAAAFAVHTASRIEFAVPVGSALGGKIVVGIYPGNEVALGSFTIVA